MLHAIWYHRTSCAPTSPITSNASNTMPYLSHISHDDRNSRLRCQAAACCICGAPAWWPVPHVELPRVVPSQVIAFNLGAECDRCVVACTEQALHACQTLAAAQVGVISMASDGQPDAVWGTQAQHACQAVADCKHFLDILNPTSLLCVA
jgi:hypothetical protein